VNHLLGVKGVGRQFFRCDTGQIPIETSAILTPAGIAPLRPGSRDTLVTGFVQGAYDCTSEIFDYLEAFSKYKVLYT
jgi:hypothetical protein